jgi:chromate transporter
MRGALAQAPFRKALIIESLSASAAVPEVPPPASTEAPLARPATLTEMFLSFNRLALQGFGGVLPVAQREFVERQRWLTDAQFVEMLSIGQVLPGPNIINVSLMIGDKFFGFRGAMVALAGMLAGPLVIVLALAMLYGEFARIPMVANALRGMGAVSAGLIIATALKLMRGLRTNPIGPLLCTVYGAATMVMIILLKWPLLAVLAVLGPLGMYSAWRKLGP